MSSLRPGGRHGLSSRETRDPIGLAVAAVNRLAQSELIDRVGLRRQAEQVVFSTTRNGFRAATAAGRTYARAGRRTAGTRPANAAPSGVFDLTPTDDEQMLVDVVQELAAELLRPAASAADEACAAPVEVLAAAQEVGLPVLGVPDALGGIMEERSAMAGTLVAEALAHGDMGLAVATLAPGAVATAIGLWGTEAQQQTYLPAFAGADVPVAALTIAEPTVLFDPFSLATTALRDGDGYVLDGVKSAVVRGAEAELFVVAAQLDGTPALFLVESGADGLEVEADPSMGLRAAGLVAPAPHRRARRRGRAARRRRGHRLPRVRTPLPAGVVRPGGRHRPGRARPRQGLRQRAAGLRRADQPPPVRRLHGRRHGDRAAGDAAGDVEGRLARHPRPGLRPRGRRWPASCAPRRGCGSVSTASSCSAATASSRNTRWNGGTATCGPSA